MILGILGSTLGAGGVLGGIGAVGAGALGSGLGRWAESGDFEEGLKTGAVSLLGGHALKGLLGGMGGAEKVAASPGVKAVDAIPNYGQQLAQQNLGQQGFGSGIKAAIQNPISLGQATLAQGTVPPPALPESEDVEFDNRERMSPRRIMRRPPLGYRPGFDPEFDYGVAPNYGTQVMNMGGLVGLLGNQKVQDALSNVVGISLNPAMQREANNLMTGEFTPKGYSPLTMADVGMREGGMPDEEMEDMSQLMPMKEEEPIEEMAMMASPDVEDNPTKIIMNAVKALQGISETPEQDIQIFVQTFGPAALEDLKMKVASGEVGEGEEGGLRNLIQGEGDGMSDSIDAEIVDQLGDQSGTGSPLQVANNEYIVAADVVADLGNGSTEAGARQLDEMMKRVRLARHGTEEQPPEVNTEQLLPA